MTRARRGGGVERFLVVPNTLKDVLRAYSVRLEAVVSRWNALVDWEKRARSGSDFRMRVSVEPVQDLCRRLDHPERRFRSVHVAGSKGKGTVSALIAAALRRVGKSEGLYTSPHVERVHERIRIHGVEIEEDPLVEALEVALNARDAALAEGTAGRDATWFDVLTVAAFVAMARAAIEVAVVECGLGGRLDSTNVLAAPVCVITSIYLEHVAILGATREAIAAEKAGIVSPGATLVAGLLGESDAVRRVFEAVAKEKGARLCCVPFEPSESIAERNQRLASVALEALEETDPAFQGLAVALDRDVCAGARLPGRAELRRRAATPVWMDGAHVPASLELVLRDLPALGAPRTFPVVVFGVGVEKDAQGLLKALRGRVDRVLCTSVGPGPYRGADELAALADELGLAARAVPDPAAALEEAVKDAGTSGWVLVTGSLHLVGALRGLTQPW